MLFLKVSGINFCFQNTENLGESFPQATIQITLVAFEGLSDDIWHATFRIISIIISILSILIAFSKTCTSGPHAKVRGVTYKNLFCFWEHYICCHTCLHPPKSNLVYWSNYNLYISQKKLHD